MIEVTGDADFKYLENRPKPSVISRSYTVTQLRFPTTPLPNSTVQFSENERTQ